jgi:hypothetical protein
MNTVKDVACQTDFDCVKKSKSVEFFKEKSYQMTGSVPTISYRRKLSGLNNMVAMLQLISDGKTLEETFRAK